MPDTDFYDLDELEKIAVNLFYGWGYNFYRLENQLRTDDLTIRAKVGWLLGSARASVETAESAYRRERLPEPTREKPRPDAGAVAGAQMLERLSKEIGSLEGRIRAQPAPENDRMTQRYRHEAATLQHLRDCDMELAGARRDAAGHARPKGRRLDDREIRGDPGRPQEHRDGVAGAPGGVAPMRRRDGSVTGQNSPLIRGRRASLLSTSPSPIPAMVFPRERSYHSFQAVSAVTPAA